MYGTLNVSTHTGLEDDAFALYKVNVLPIIQVTKFCISTFLSFTFARRFNTLLQLIISLFIMHVEIKWFHSISLLAPYVE